jgi:hypothetical protein
MWPPRLRGDAGRAPSLHHFYSGICLTTEEKSRKNLSGHPKSARVNSADHDSFSRLGHIQTMALTGLLAPAALGFRVGRWGQPSVSVNICRVAELEGSPRQLTFSRSSRSGLWCGRRIVEHPDPRGTACYWGTKGHPITRRKHFDCNTCSLRTCVRLA